LLNFCKDLANQDFIVEDSSECWFEQLAAHAQKMSPPVTFPTATSQDFNKVFDSWMKTKEGMVTRAKQIVGIDDNNKIFFVEVQAKTNLKMWG